MDIKKIVELASKERFAVKKHAVQRMWKRGISKNALKTALLSCEIVESYGDDYPLPSCLLLGYCEAKPLHIVVALSTIDDMLWVVTAYWPSEAKWLLGFKERKTR